MENTKKIKWQGIEYDSMEDCSVLSGEDNHSIYSTIHGRYDIVQYDITYEIHLNSCWQTILCEIRGSVDGRDIHILLTSDEHVQWKLNGSEAPHFSGCIDVDIPITPSTNALPVNRLNLKIGDEEIINVIYIDLLEDRISAVKQKYQCISDHVYHYENIPNDFEADIFVDGDGFVINYPGLFVRE